jgi:uncharacterized membrane protein (GlpM family)
MNLLIKFALSALVIVIVSEVVVKRGAWLGSLIASLPLVSLISFIWIYRDAAQDQRIEKLASHSTGVFWFVLPSLPMFLLFPWLLRKGLSFWSSLGLGCLLTIALYLIMLATLKKFGISL